MLFLCTQINYPRYQDVVKELWCLNIIMIFMNNIYHIYLFKIINNTCNVNFYWSMCSLDPLINTVLLQFIIIKNYNNMYIILNIINYIIFLACIDD